ncbi:MAG: response regulator [Chloroflexi bacterium]|nr:response regulator [Chloroflexota bacterium]MDA1239428.1 response regulator [Chloroflexota bacterium]
MAFTDVVIVDDEVDHAIISRRVLAQVAPSVAVTVFTDPHGIEARLLDVSSGALVLIDRVLGRSESFGLIERLSAARPDLCLVMLSAVLSPEDHQRALRGGASAAAQKPGDLSGWRRLFEELLDPRSGEQADSVA